MTALKDKILSRADVVARYGRPRNERVVFTNGCFDLLHLGHVEYLEQAKSLGDVLVVGLNTDDSVRRLKGSGRPLVGEGDRARVLAGLASIDAVTLFGEDTPLEFLAQLLPDVMVKGGDYTVAEIVGRQVVEAAGGTVTVVPFVGNYSTSALFERLKEDP